MSVRSRSVRSAGGYRTNAPTTLEIVENFTGIMYAGPSKATVMKALRVRDVLADDSGATMVEYSLVIAFISILCVVGVSYLGHAIKNLILSW